MDGTTSTKLCDTEPVAVVSVILNSFKTLVLAGIALALAFDWVSWSDEQNAAVLGVVAAVFVVISSVAASFLRRKVTPVANARAADGTRLVKEGSVVAPDPRVDVLSN
jgi:hypothetical protein